eukprot:XP_013969934.1 basic salivary proline-rich protein 2-like [Canis lupus familiaris]
MTGATLEAETYLFSPSHHQSGVNGGHWEKLNTESSISSSYLQTSESRKKSHKTQPPVAISARKPEAREEPPPPPKAPAEPRGPRGRTVQGCVVSRAPPSGIRGSVSCSHGAGQTDRPSGAPATPHPRADLGNHLLGPLRLRDQPPPAWRWAPRGDPPPPPDRPAGPPGGGRPAPPPAPVTGVQPRTLHQPRGTWGRAAPPLRLPPGVPPHAGSPLRGFLHKLGPQGTPWLTWRAARAGRGASRPNDGGNMGPLRTRQGPGQQVHESLKQAKGHPSGDSTASVSIPH